MLLRSGRRRGLSRLVAGGAPPGNPWADDVKAMEELCARSPPQSDNDFGLKDQPLDDVFWVLDECPSSTCYLCCKLTKLAMPRLTFLSLFLFFYVFIP